MIAHDGRERNFRRKIFNLREPIFPLHAVFAVVDEIAQVREKIRVGVLLKSKSGEFSPGVVAAAALRIGKNYRFELVVRNFFHLVPSRHAIAIDHAEFVAEINRRAVLNVIFSVVGEARILRGENFFVVAKFYFDGGIFQRLVDLPHDKARFGNFFRDDLPQKFDVQNFFSVGNFFNVGNFFFDAAAREKCCKTRRRNFYKRPPIHFLCLNKSSKAAAAA